MTNDEYCAKLETKIETLMELRRQGIELARDILGKSLTKEDLFFCAALDRCLHLQDGFVTLLKERNLTCAGAVLRLQMDNCMRTYAAFVADDKNGATNCMIHGTPIKHLKDKSGNKMTDGYLKDKLTELDSRFCAVYNQASGYIHLSEKAFYQTVTEINEDGKLTLQVGHPLPERGNETLLEGAAAFIHFVKLHYKMLSNVVESKNRYDAAQLDE